MFGKFLQRWFGNATDSPLDRAAKRDAAGPTRGRDYAQPAGTIGTDRMTPAQRVVAAAFSTRVRAYCQHNNYDFNAFHGPYLRPADTPEARKTAAAVLGACDDPHYAAWELELGCPHGTIGAFGDSNGQMKVYREGMYLPRTGN